MSKIRTISETFVLRTPRGTKSRYYKPVPSLVLSGIWLQELGFEIGSKIEINSQKNEITIKSLNV